MRHGLVALALSVAVLQAAALGAPKQTSNGAVYFILDCSHSMAEPAVPGPGIRPAAEQQPSTRMEAAQSLLRAMLDELATTGNYKVGVALIGHRLAWEEVASQPELRTQDRYLEATNGFESLNGLLPGDDVEVIRTLGPFDADAQRAVVERLDLARPWGDRPLYLAIARAIDALATLSAREQARIVVLTDGGNRQKLARYATAHERIIDALKQNIIPVHFVHVGPPADDADELKLRDVAEQGGGSLVHVRASDRLTLAQLASGRHSLADKAPAAPVETGRDSETAAKVAAAKALFKPNELSVSGAVTYNGRPVTSAEVRLEGSGVQPVKVDRQGRFLLRKVPAGKQYKVRVKAIAMNRFREKTVELDVPADAEQPPVIAIELE